MTSFIFLPRKDRSLTKTPSKYVQCSLYKYWLHHFPLSRIFINGSAYLDKLAVKITISKYSDNYSRKASTPGLTSTYTSHFLSSISIERTISGESGGLKEECTNVSSKSRTKVFLFLFLSDLGNNKPSPSNISWISSVYSLI